MTRTIQRLADRMVARLVPATRAEAVNCWYEVSGCVRRYCCKGSGVNYCTNWQYIC
ncbi:hypothetical protein GCM10009530_51310 [Microbispora corallina]|uniref:Uncharacterized protein n=1 Tax=Microbispora corallina TaxID=83302 RepID=A0ABQ4G6M4_9ACTN|nr:hypothetical protein [Microbispora corallina]GIH42724.1 hypothetical protein Mco01_57240 [Microbispora corallina]